MDRISLKRTTKKRDIFLLVVSRAVHIFGEYVINPQIPFYAIYIDSGSSNMSFHLSLLMASNNVGRMISGPLMAYAGGQQGAEWVIACGYLLSAILHACMIFISNIWLLMASRVAVGMCCVSSLHNVCVADRVQDNHLRAEFLSLQSGLNLVMTFVALLIFGAVNHRRTTEQAWILLLSLSSAVDVVAALTVLVVRRKDDSKRRCSTKEESLIASRIGNVATVPKKDLLTLIKAPKFRGLLAIGFFSGLSYATTSGPEVLFLQTRFNFTEVEYSAWSMTIAAASVVGSIVATPVSDRLGFKLTCVWIELSSAVATLLMFWPSAGAYDVLPFTYGILCLGVFHVIVSIVKTSYFTGMVHGDSAASLLGAQSALSSLGGIIGPILGGAVYKLSIYLPYVFSMIFFLLTMCIYHSLDVAIPDARRKQLCRKFRLAGIIVKTSSHVKLNVDESGTDKTKHADESGSDSGSDSDSEDDLEVTSWTHGTDGVVETAFSVSQLILLKGTCDMVYRKHRPRMARQ